MVKKGMYLLGLLMLMVPTLAFAEGGDAPTVESLQGNVTSIIGGLDSLWTMIAAILVIFMQAGFIMLETGSTRMKNAAHVAGKTIFTFGLATIVFWVVGYGLIFGGKFAADGFGGNGFLGWGDFFFNPLTFNEIGGYDGLAPSIFFVFQLAFAAVSLAIAWGGFAERGKLSVYLIFTVVFIGIIYPTIAHWIWAGNGWLFGEGKQDFAGSTVVHLTGAMAALAATILLKPRIGKFNKDGTANQILGHNQVFTTMGVIILWFGWFGFNAGSTTAVGDGFFGFVAFNTQIAAGAAAVAALIISWIVMGKADIGVTLNGALAGLVAITASCAFVEPWAAVVIGLVAGILVFFSMKMFEKMGIDDPIYALSVHGMAGIWGTLSNGLFATPELSERLATGGAGLFYGGGFAQMWVQIQGVVSAGLFAFVVSFITLYIIKLIIGLRVSEEEEIMGLDLAEHGAYGYPEHVKEK